MKTKQSGIIGQAIRQKRRWAIDDQSARVDISRHWRRCCWCELRGNGARAYPRLLFVIKGTEILKMRKEFTMHMFKYTVGPFIIFPLSHWVAPLEERRNSATTKEPMINDILPTKSKTMVQFSNCNS